MILLKSENQKKWIHLRESRTVLLPPNCVFPELFMLDEKKKEISQFWAPILERLIHASRIWDHS